MVFRLRMFKFLIENLRRFLIIYVVKLRVVMKKFFDVNW